MESRWRWAVTVGVVGLVLAPAVLPAVDDDFPLSTYPMFTAERGEVVDLHTAVRVDETGRHRLSPAAIGGTVEIVAAAVAVGRAVAGGSTATALLCAEIADRVDGRGEIQIVTERHEALALLRDGAEPLTVTLHQRCPA